MFKSLKFHRYRNNQGDFSWLLSSNNKTEFLYFLQISSLNRPLQYSRKYRHWYVRISDNLYSTLNNKIQMLTNEK